MAQIFRPFTNALARGTVYGAAAFVGVGLWVLFTAQHSDYASGRGVVRDQPVPFSHEHHVAGLGIDCRYCHVQVETEAFAGMPATEVCMTCHAQIWRDADMLAPVRRSLDEGRPLRWLRVNDLPDFVYFHHGAHVAGGIGCSTCHGRVDRMPLTWQSETLFMRWCMDCHEQPAPFRRRPDEVFDMDWTPRPAAGAPPPDPLLRDCSVCHR